MDLGLEELNDEQIVELLQAVVENITHRDLAAFTVAQQKVWDHAAKAEFAARELKGAMDRARDEEEAKLRAAIGTEIRSQHKQGKLRLLTPEEEAAACAEGELETRIALIDETLKSLEKEPEVEFYMHITPHEAVVSSGRKVIQAPLPRPEQVRAITDMIRRILI